MYIYKIVQYDLFSLFIYYFVLYCDWGVGKHYTILVLAITDGL